MSISSVNSTTSQIYQSLFKTLDTDKSGGISLTEIKSASSDATDEKSAELLTSLDKDGDGVLSQAELKTAFEKVSTAVQNELLDLKTASPTTATSSLLQALYDSVSTDAVDATGSATASADAPPPPPASAPSSSDSTSSDDPADLNHDGTVSELERLAYEGMSAGAATASSTLTQQVAQATTGRD